ncbi:MAG: ATP-dependent DNA helicase RecG [Actinomycetota bacterium]|nr:ATP-dependent DNA helicase RecG [Actinomycetota bacterium]
MGPSELEAAPVRYPRPSMLAVPLRVQGVKTQHAAQALGLGTVGDLLEHLPRESREARALAQLAPGDSATVVVSVRSIASRPVRRRGMRPLVEATVADESAQCRATFFNQPWLVARYPAGTQLILHGKLEAGNRFRVQAHAPSADGPRGEASGSGGTGQGTAGQGAVAQEAAGQRAVGQGAVGHYPASEGLSSTQILALVRRHAAALADFGEPLPVALRTVEGLPDRPAALAAVHFPETGRDQEVGIRRLAFEELLLAQLALLRRRAVRRGASAAPILAGERELSARWLGSMLPFSLTEDQRRALDAIDRDLAQPRPMQRLLMGEVGSGKTVVALYALLRAVEHGLQGALMAPTETLAEQHFATVQKLMPGEAISIGLLTGSTPARRRSDLQSKLATGECSLVVGTHALIEEAVRFARLGVAVVDEQHRFGVRQRAALDAKGAHEEVPHVLHMTATPIPRTLALRNYGDLDFAFLRELPQGRQPVETFVCTSERERARAYDRMREELRAGRQAFVVCPLVADSDLLQARAASAEFKRLGAGELRDFRLALLHGQLRSAEKQAAMAAFASGDADVLVATSVIEVGIDVPNATLMLVEDAERYGISQLHQLRGRIGRGGHASVCLLFGRADSSRLQALARHADGFELAEIDLGLRGEGELVGTQQHGLAQFRVAQLPRDGALLARARAHAEQITSADPELGRPEHVLLGDALARTYGTEAQAPIRA